MNTIVVAGIGTGIGKTLFSAILVETLHADYWKPVQAGNLDESDTMEVKRLITNQTTRFHPEAFQLSYPMSPHAAARLDGIELRIKDLVLPSTKNELVIEPAGGLMVPLNTRELMLDFVRALDAPVIVVSKNYLGSINHTLLTVEALKNSGIKILGLVFNGERNTDTEIFIERYTTLPVLLRINEEKEITRDLVSHYATILRNNFLKYELI